MKANSGLRDLLLDPNVTEGAVAAELMETVYTTATLSYRQFNL